MDTLHLSHHLEPPRRNARGASGLVFGVTSDLEIMVSRGQTPNLAIMLVILGTVYSVHPPSERIGNSNFD